MINHCVVCCVVVVNQGTNDICSITVYMSRIYNDIESV